MVLCWCEGYLESFLFPDLRGKTVISAFRMHRHCTHCMWKWLNKWKHTAYSTALQLIIHCAAPFIDEVLHTKSIKLGHLNKRLKAILMYTESTNTESACCFSFSLCSFNKAGSRAVTATLFDCMLQCFGIWNLIRLWWNGKLLKSVICSKTRLDV